MMMIGRMVAALRSRLSNRVKPYPKDVVSFGYFLVFHVLHCSYMFGGFFSRWQGRWQGALCTTLLCVAIFGVAQTQIAHASTTDYVFTLITDILNGASNGIGWLTLKIIDILLVNILSYNSFSNSSIVTLGWTLIRDMVNMIAVVVLLIVAIKIILGQASASLQQHLPKFFLGVLFANFSKTLCGLAVDASQIVMMTFVNAILSISAGNFAHLFSMPSLTTFSENSAASFTQTALTPFVLFINVYVKIILQAIVFAILALLTFAFLWRIVILWVAFIMAPLALFSWGAMDSVKWLGRVWSQWIEQFVPPLVLGPMLTFFLYLALAVSSKGGFAESQGFVSEKQASDTNVGGLFLSIFESTNLAGLLLAAVFILIGISESSKIAAKMGGLASMAVNEKMAKKAVRFGSYIAGATAGTAIKTSARVFTKGSSVVGRGIELAGESPWMKKNAPGMVGSGLKLTGGFIKNVSDRADEEVRRVPKGLADLVPLDGKVPDYYKNRAGAAMDVAGTKIGEGGKFLAGTIKDAAQYTRDKAQKSGGLGGRIVESLATNLESTANSVVNPLMEVSSALGAEVHHISDEEKKKAKDRVSHMSKDEKILRLQQYNDGVGDKTVGAIADAKVLTLEILGDKKMRDAYKEHVGASYDKHVADAIGQFAHEEDADHLSISKDEWNKLRSQFLPEYIKTGDLSDNKHREKLQKFVGGNDINMKEVPKDALKNPEIFAFFANAKTGKKDGDKEITKLDQVLSGEHGVGHRDAAQSINISNFNENSFKVDKGASPDEQKAQAAVADNALRAFSRVDGRLTPNSSSEQDTITSIKTALEELKNNNDRRKNFSEKEISAIENRLVASFGKTIDDAVQQFEYVVKLNAEASAQDRRKLRDMIKDDLSIVGALNDTVLSGNQAQKIIFENLSKEVIQNMKDRHGREVRTDAQVKASFDNIEKVLASQELSAYGGANQAENKARKDQFDVFMKEMAQAIRLKLSVDEIKNIQTKIDAMEKTFDKEKIAKVKELRATADKAARY